jgi:hypothetical protein
MSTTRHRNGATVAASELHLIFGRGNNCGLARRTEINLSRCDQRAATGAKFKITLS